MGALFRLFLVAIVVFIGTILAAWAFYFWTPMGRASMKELVEERLAAATESNVEISALEGKLPNEVVLKNAAFSASGGDWLLIKNATLKWRPLALFSGQIEIEFASIDDAVLMAPPPRRKTPRQKLKGFEIPDRLPQVGIRKIVVNNLRFTKAIAGEDLRLDGAGDLLTGGRDLSVNFTLTSSDARDYAAAHIKRSGAALSTQILVQSAADGAISLISGMDGPVYVEARGDGPLSDYRLNLNASLGAFGALDGHIAGDLGRMEKLAIDVDMELGERLANTKRLIGQSAALKGAFLPLPQGGAVEVSSFRSDLGAATAMVKWRNRNDALERVDITAAATLEENWRPDLRPYIGDTIEIDGSVRPDGENYSVLAAIKAALFDGAVNNAKTDLRTFAKGPLVATLAKNPALPTLLNAGAQASGEVSIIFGERIEGKSVVLKTAQGGGFSGDAGYNFDTKAFFIKGDASASPALIAKFNPKLAAQGNASGAIDVKGHPDKFGATLAAITPPFQIGGKAFPAARLTLAAADMPHTPSGRANVQAINGSLHAKSNFARSSDGAWRAEGIDYAGADFAMKGSVAVDQKRGAIEMDLAYRGTGKAEPWPGVILIGDVAAKGAIAPSGAENRLFIRSGALSANNFSVQLLDATIEGPPKNLSIKASAGDVSVKGAAPLNDFSTEISASIGKSINLRMTKLSGGLAGAELALKEPAVIDFNKGVTVRNFKTEIGRSGFLAIDGAISKERWLGAIVARRAPILSAASVIDFDLNLDTDRKLPASGSFLVSSLLTKSQDATLSGRFSWDGRTVTIADDNTVEAFDLSLSATVLLTRSPALRLSTNGPVRGDARYFGRVETVAGFLPAALQSAEGKLELVGTLSGELSAPRVEGALTVSEGAFTELATGLSIVNIDATARADGALSGSRIQFSGSGSGVSQKEKTISASGALTIGKDQRLASKITLTNAKLSAGPIAEVDASGAIDLSGPFDHLLAKGDLVVKSLDARVFTPETTGLVDIKVVTIDRTGRPLPAASATIPAASISYAVRIKGDDRIFIRGRGLTSEWRADVAISGRAEDPQILGAMKMKSGDITFAGRRFDMTKGEIAFDSLSVNNPSLDLRAERNTKSGTLAVITIEGRARAPKISLTSTPALPPEDIMALVLFDKPANELTAIESLQVAEGLAELGGIGPFGGNGVTGSARQALGLDLLNVDINQADSAASSLTVGKYVARGLFVSATQDARGENGSVRIEYEIKDSVTVETELRQDGDQKASVNWKRDF